MSTAYKGSTWQSSLVSRISIITVGRTCVAPYARVRAPHLPFLFSPSTLRRRQGGVRLPEATLPGAGTHRDSAEKSPGSRVSREFPKARSARPEGAPRHGAIGSLRRLARQPHNLCAASTDRWPPQAEAGLGRQLAAFVCIRPLQSDDQRHIDLHFLGHFVTPWAIRSQRTIPPRY